MLIADYKEVFVSFSSKVNSNVFWNILDSSGSKGLRSGSCFDRNKGFDYGTSWLLKPGSLEIVVFSNPNPSSVYTTQKYLCRMIKN